MRTGIFLTAASVLAATLALGQELNSNGAFEVTILHRVTVGSKVLQPGDYWMQPLNFAGGDAPILRIRPVNDQKGEFEAQVVATAENRIQPATRVTYQRVGRSYYLDRIWVRGLTYGFKFPLPKNAAQ